MTFRRKFSATAQRPAPAPTPTAAAIDTAGRPARPGGEASASALRAEAALLRALFDGAYDAWEVAGAVRRNQPARGLVHLVLPRAGGPADALADRAYDLVMDGRAGPLWVRADGQVDGGPAAGACPFPAARRGLVRLLFGGRLHQLWPATRADWGPLLAWLTGPAGYWDLLEARLTDAGRLAFARGLVCALDYVLVAGVPDARPRPIECPTEAEFFLLARTKWCPPPSRRAPAGGGDWRRGMRRPYHPPDFDGPPAAAAATPQAKPVSPPPGPADVPPARGPIDDPDPTR